MQWFQDTTNLNYFAHVSHTFTHQDENNATYSDVYKEITWNTAWMKDVGISKAKKFSPVGLIPPAITGMHNGDAIKGWVDGGIKNVVGDNTRALLLNEVRTAHLITSFLSLCLHIPSKMSIGHSSQPLLRMVMKACKSPHVGLPTFITMLV